MNASRFRALREGCPCGFGAGGARGTHLRGSKRTFSVGSRVLPVPCLHCHIDHGQQVHEDGPQGSLECLRDVSLRGHRDCERLDHVERIQLPWPAPLPVRHRRHRQFALGPATFGSLLRSRSLVAGHAGSEGISAAVASASHVHLVVPQMVWLMVSTCTRSLTRSCESDRIRSPLQGSR